MITVQYAKDRIVAALNEIDRLKQSDFPYAHARGALDIVEKNFRQRLNTLEKLPAGGDPAVANNACAVSLYQLFLYLPILGFILRSTNTRNAFEVHSPLLRLARIVLPEHTRLIISSEWDYSPFVYTAINDLPDYVLIGLPASESSNPLLIPLAGHELGHSVWGHNKLEAKFSHPVETAVLSEIRDKCWAAYTLIFPQHSRDALDKDMFARSSWLPAYTWALLQIEEIYCDILGVRMFGEAYLHAFAYLISPRTLGQRSLNYPNHRRRVAHIEEAARAFKVVVPSGFDTRFDDADEPNEPITRFLVDIADSVSARFVPDAVKEVEILASRCSIPNHDATAANEIRRAFGVVVPASNPPNLVTVLNAAWECAHDTSLWQKLRHIKQEDRTRILHDLVLKTVEVLEIKERLRP